MKKIILTAMILGSLTAMISSCKKAENDPAISLLSRKARLTGEWTCTKSEERYESFDPAGVSQGFELTVFDGVNSTESDENGVIDVTPYTLKYTFNKNNTYERIYSYTTKSSTTKGSWGFVGKSKEQDLKKKEAIYLVSTSNIYTNSNSSSTSSNTYKSIDQIFELGRLSNKEMIITYSNESKDETGERDVNTFTATFIKK